MTSIAKVPWTAGPIRTKKGEVNRILIPYSVNESENRPIVSFIPERNLESSSDISVEYDMV